MGGPLAHNQALSLSFMFTTLVGLAKLTPAICTYLSLKNSPKLDFLRDYNESFKVNVYKMPIKIICRMNQKKFKYKAR